MISSILRCAFGRRQLCLLCVVGSAFSSSDVSAEPGIDRASAGKPVKLTVKSHRLPGQADVRSDASAPTALSLSRENASRSQRQSRWAPAASVVPGVLLHGSGSWVLGERRAATRLLLLEGIGIGSVLGSGLGLALTGASPYTVVPFAVGAIGGVSLLGSALLLDVYNTVAPDAGWGLPRRYLPRLEASLGYVYVADVQFSYHHFIWHRLTLRSGPWFAFYSGKHAPEQQHDRQNVGLGYTLWGKQQGRMASDGSHSSLFTAGRVQNFQEYGFRVWETEVQWTNRLDSQRIVADIHGAFLEFDVGLGYRLTRYAGEGNIAPAEQRDSLLLARTAFGIYLGQAEHRGGELMLYYNHRHDDLAAGMKLPGLASGVPGHVGLSGFGYFGDWWGIEGFVEVGSAWVSGLALRIRGGTRL